jgi:hypothetical protein
MNNSDSSQEMKRSIADYIRQVPLNAQRFGITLYNTEPEIIPAKPADMSDEDYNNSVQFFKEYTYFTSDTQKENVIKLVESVPYAGNTSTGGALTIALARMVRATGNDADNIYSNNRDLRHYPGIVLLFSDGQNTDPIYYSDIQYYSSGYGNTKLIPVNTIYYSAGEIGGENVMREISRLTGGNFSYTTERGYAGIFTDSYQNFNLPTPSLLFAARGPLADNGGRWALQIVFIFIWLAASAFAVYLMLGNKKLFKSFFLVKLLWVFIAAIAGVCLIQLAGGVGLIVGQVIITMSFAAAIPVYHYEIGKNV